MEWVLKERKREGRAECETGGPASHEVVWGVDERYLQGKKSDMVGLRVEMRWWFEMKRRFWLTSARGRAWIWFRPMICRRSSSLEQPSATVRRILDQICIKSWSIVLKLSPYLQSKESKRVERERRTRRVPCSSSISLFKRAKTRR